MQIKTDDELNDIYVQTLTYTATSFVMSNQSSIDEITPEIIEFDDCLSKLKNFKNLIKQFEQKKNNNHIVDLLYCELSLLQCAYNHSDFLVSRKITRRN